MVMHSFVWKISALRNKKAIMGLCRVMVIVLFIIAYLFLIISVTKWMYLIQIVIIFLSIIAQLLIFTLFWK